MSTLKDQLVIRDSVNLQKAVNLNQNTSENGKFSVKIRNFIFSSCISIFFQEKLMSLEDSSKTAQWHGL